jgi:F420-non-reducing hydrogenase large subunit
VKRTIAIDPVTRIEGHAKVLIEVNDDGSPINAGMVVNELRGFERILVGTAADQLPMITARICGVCPSAHHLAACKALDNAAGVEPPPAAKLLRELLYMGHLIHSHTLSLFVLQGPDLVMGLDADPAVRNIVGVVQAQPEVAKKALRLRSLGQKINEMVGGRGVHPVTGVAGGITFALDKEKHATLKNWTDEAVRLAPELAGVAKTLLFKLVDAHPNLLQAWDCPTWYMGTVKDGVMNFYDGQLRMMNTEGEIIREIETSAYDQYLTEVAWDWSYMKPMFIKDGNELRTYRVNSLGRCNTSDSIDTPLANQEFQAFRSQFGRPCHNTLMLTYGRVIELIYACERAKVLVDHPQLWGETRVPVKFRGGRGVGHVEAPRGTLIHDYDIDDTGIVRRANLIVATQQNYDAINQSIMKAAETHIKDAKGDGLLNAIEFAIRCYDPCLSCATHAVGFMPLEIEIHRNGSVVRHERRP